MSSSAHTSMPAYTPESHPQPHTHPKQNRSNPKAKELTFDRALLLFNLLARHHGLATKNHHAIHALAHRGAVHDSGLYQLAGHGGFDDSARAHAAAHLVADAGCQHDTAQHCRQANGHEGKCVESVAVVVAFVRSPM